MSRFDEHSDEHFQVFARDLEASISKYGNVPHKELVKKRQAYVERLVGLEAKLRKKLRSHPLGASTYRDFISYICDERRNILAARPFFRERSSVFTDFISPALKERNVKKLMKYHFNYEFVKFVADRPQWQPLEGPADRMRGGVRKLTTEIRDLRWKLIEMNMPLAINRARIFWGRTPRSHLSYMDLVQIASTGLMAGIDKFSLPRAKAAGNGATIDRMIGSTVIGRMVGNLIENYSETQVHFFPADKRKIYRANKALVRMGQSPDWDKVVAMVNDGVEGQFVTNRDEIQDLVAAASTVSADVPSRNEHEEGAGEEMESQVASFVAPEANQPDVIVEEMQAYRTLGQAIARLPIIAQKLLRLRGVAL